MELRDGLKNAPFMEYPTADGKFTLITNASKSSTRYLLNQETEDGTQHVIACGGRSLKPSREKLYHHRTGTIINNRSIRQIQTLFVRKTLRNKIRPCQLTIFKLPKG